MEMNVKFMFIGCLYLISVLDIVQSKCTISKDWVELSMEERLLMAETVVYGKTKEHRANTKTIAGKSYYEIDAVFEVFCVLKQGEEQVNDEIIIERIAPRDGCSGTRQHMKIGQEAIVGLKMTSGGNYEYDEAMPTQSVSFAATKMNFYSLSLVCDLQSWSAPVNATANKCPICGTGNFSETAMASAAKTKMLPCFIDGVQVGNISDCNVFTTSNIDTTSTCISADFDQTCARIMYTIPAVTCECSVTPSQKMNFGNLGEIDAGLSALPCLTTVIFSLLTVLFTT